MTYHSFEEWMAAVDRACQRQSGGVSIHDLEDQPFMAWYEDEMPPADAAAEALSYSGFPE